eukprot:s10125_g2.t1
MAAARRASASRAASVAFHQDNFGTGELKPTRLLNQDPPWPTRRHEDRHARLRRPRRLHRPALGEDAAAQDRPWHGGENLLGDLCEWIAQPVLEGTASSSGLNFEEGGGADEEDDLGEDKARFGEHRANAALADEEKDKKRIIHDATHGVKEKAIGYLVVGDISKAHRRYKHQANMDIHGLPDRRAGDDARRPG